LLAVSVFQDLAPAARRRWLHRKDRPARPGRVDAEATDRSLGYVLLLRLHDPGKRRVPWLLLALVHRRKRGKRSLPDLVTALDLAPELDSAFDRNDLRDRRHVRPPQKLGERRADEALIVIGRLLPAEHKVRLRFLDYLRESARDAEWCCRIGCHERGLVAAHRESSCWSPVYQSAKTTTANAMASITRVNAIAKMVVPSVKSTSSPAFPRRAPERRPGVSAPARPLPRRLPQA